MQQFILILMVLGTVSTASAQSIAGRASRTDECKLELSQAPVIRGIRLGMNVDEALALFSEPEEMRTTDGPHPAARA